MIPVIATYLVLFAMPLFGHAQIPSSDQVLTLDPPFPQTVEPYTATLTGNSDNRASIQWFVNGKEQTASHNLNSIDLVAPPVTQTQTVVARITSIDGRVQEVRHTVTPYRVDVIISADTVAPWFYQGRKLPSSGSRVTATALVFNKSYTPSSNFSYLWRVDGKVQNGGALLGVNTMTFTPSFGTTQLVSVEIKDASGKTVAMRTVTVPIAKPEIQFYEHNPLLGVSSIALKNPYIFTGEETTILAESYFMSPRLSASQASRAWKINGVSVAGNADNPNELTLNKKGKSGSAELSFAIDNLQQLLQTAQKKLTIQF